MTYTLIQVPEEAAVLLTWPELMLGVSFGICFGMLAYDLVVWAVKRVRGKF